MVHSTLERGYMQRPAPAKQAEELITGTAGTPHLLPSPWDTLADKQPSSASA